MPTAVHPTPNVGDTKVLVIGAGQAGLAVSHELSAADVQHVVLERGRVGETWRGRWDSFCLVTPNWSVLLPGGAYTGSDPDGYMARDSVVAHLESYAESFRAPIQRGIEVTSVMRDARIGFNVETSTGSLRAETVVVATGAYQKPHRPPAAAALPHETFSIDAEQYSRPEALPPGRVLVVGSGQTGCQLSEELYHSGRDVLLACGRAPWAPRRIAGRDFFSWIVETPFMETTPMQLPNERARLIANVQATGHDGGHDLHYRTLQALGVRLLGHLTGVADGRVHFASDLEDSVAFGDARYEEIRELLSRHCASRGVPMPTMPDPEPFRARAVEHVALRDLGAVIFTSGFRPDYDRWVRVPAAFDTSGFPLHVEGQSTGAPGLFFVGVHFLRKRKSSLLYGVGEDATVVARAITAASRA
jgi:putative flavoprotein involved in K+ transport